MGQNSQSNAPDSSPSTCSVSAVNVQSGLEMYESIVRTVETLQQPLKTIFQVYLEENVLIVDNGVDFDAFDW